MNSLEIGNFALMLQWHHSSCGKMMYSCTLQELIEGKGGFVPASITK